MLKPPSKKPVVIVEIGNEWLKIAESRFAAGGRCITKARFMRLVDITSALPEAISKIFHSMKLARYGVITYLPRHLATVRILELPSTDPKEISDMVNLQVGKQTPYSKEEIVSAYNIIDTAREGYIKIMLVIARRNIVSERIEAFTKSGLGVETVGISSEGVFNWFNACYASAIKQYFSQSIALLDIDSNCSDFIVIRNGKLIFTRNIFIGAGNISGDREGQQQKFVEELTRSIERYRAEEKTSDIVKMFLSGAAKNIKGLDQVLSAGLGIPVETTDPARNMRLKKTAGILPEEDFKFASPSALFGTAIERKKPGFDLTPPEAQIHKLMQGKRRALTMMGILLVSIAMVGSSLPVIAVYNKNAYLEKLSGKISLIEKSADEVRKMRMRIDLVEKRLDAKGATINILSEIHKLIPDEIYFTNINIEEKKQAILKGRAEAMSDVFRFVTTLENSPYFENAKTTYTTTRKKGDKEYADFEIICIYER